MFDTVRCYDVESAIEDLTGGIPHEILVVFFPPDGIIDPPEGFSPDDYSIVGKVPTATVEDGQVIDLGNRHLKVIYNRQGHRPGSLCRKK